MRKLTILRRSSFVACLAKMDIYFEDPVNPTTTIDGRPCRLLGKIKNGETVTFDIPNEGGMLYVTAGGKLSRSYCSEALPILPGEYDIYLSGQNQYSMIGANAFRFDGVNNEVTNAHRAATNKKALKVFFITLAVAFALIIGVGVLAAMMPSEPETFAVGDFSITLTDDFYTYEDEGVFYIENDDYFVAVDPYLIRDVIEYDSSLTSLEEFAEFFADGYAEDITITKALTQEDGMLYLECEEEGGLWPYHYTDYFFEYNGYYYVVTFGAEKTDYDAEEVKTWVESITFGESNA